MASHSDTRLSGGRARASLEPGRQLGVLWGGVSATLLLAAPFAARVILELPACPLRAAAGIPCLACGSGTAAVALSQLDLAGAFLSSPLATIGALGFVGGGVIAGGFALAGRGVPELPRKLSGRAKATIIAALLANWVYLIATR